MKISTSILNIMNDKEKIKNIEKYTDFYHIDVMDGKFVKNKTIPFDKLYLNIKDLKKPKDIHLMVDDVMGYALKYSKINPEYITFHLEVGNTLENINYIKSLGVKVGLAINPETDVHELDKYLEMVDLILIMSVHPGKGGQKFIDISSKIDYLDSLKDKYHYIIEVDGGINNETIKYVKKVDLAVSGSYITNSLNLKGTFKTLRGFTLIELLGVIAIIGILASVVTFSVSKSLANSRYKTCLAQEKNIKEAANMYFTDNGGESVKIKDLKAGGYLDDDLENPANSKKYSDDTVVDKNGKITYNGTDKFAGGTYDCNYLKE